MWITQIELWITQTKIVDNSDKIVDNSHVSFFLSIMNIDVIVFDDYYRYIELF